MSHLFDEQEDQSLNIKTIRGPVGAQQKTFNFHKTKGKPKSKEGLIKFLYHSNPKAKLFKPNVVKYSQT